VTNTCTLFYGVMRTTSLKVLVSRPAAPRAEPAQELGVVDFCWTPAGDLLAPNPLACDCPDCGCFAAFVGVTSAKSTTWGVVEERSMSEVTAAVRGGRHVRGWQIVEDFADFVMSQMGEIDARLRGVPVGSVLGVLVDRRSEFRLYDRTPQPSDLPLRLT
jgi:hypothetical protein